MEEGRSDCEWPRRSPGSSRLRLPVVRRAVRCRRRRIDVPQRRDAGSNGPFAERRDDREHGAGEQSSTSRLTVDGVTDLRALATLSPDDPTPGRAR